MKIGTLANLVGLTAPTIRYYESLGLIPPPRRVSGSRRYHAAALDSLRLVLALKRGGFTLTEIKALLALAPRERTRQRWRQAATEKLAELERSIGELQAARDVLAGSLDCDCDGRAGDCTLVANAGPGTGESPGRKLAPGRRSRSD